MKNMPVRKNIRLRDYDYSSSGYYFITICVKDRHNLLWDASVGAAIGRPSLSGVGNVTQKAIENIPNIYRSITIDKYVIMPNHIHLILNVSNDYEAILRDGRPMAAPTISTVINQMKGYITKQIGYSVWQKLFHDHIIRDEDEYQRIWQYIDDNPVKWDEDCYYI